jgi:hypothetical protein
MGYSLRVNHKRISTDFNPDRNEQFLYLADLRDRFQRCGHPIISVDPKKRELVGNFKNPGAGWALSPRLVNDHDFRSDSTGIAIPYGIYDLLANQAGRGGRLTRDARFRRTCYRALVAPRGRGPLSAVAATPCTE